MSETGLGGVARPGPALISDALIRFTAKRSPSKHKQRWGQITPSTLHQPGAPSDCSTHQSPRATSRPRYPHDKGRKFNPSRVSRMIRERRDSVSPSISSFSEGGSRETFLNFCHDTVSIKSPHASWEQCVVRFNVRVRATNLVSLSRPAEIHKVSRLQTEGV